MLGAITGDAIGPVYELAYTKNYNLELFMAESNYTDASVMTLALADWLLNDAEQSYEGLKDAIVLGNSNKHFLGVDFKSERVKKATARSWKTKPMEEPAIEVELSFRVSARQMAIISYGHIPEAMEDHWFMYCDDSHIRYYRSWTGLFVFDATYVKADDGDGFVIVKLRIHPNKGNSKDYERKQTALFKALLMDECGGKSEEYWDEYLQ